MDIVCDTNIWYNLGNKIIDPNTLNSNDRLIASQVNVIELSHTKNLINLPDYTRNAIQALFEYSSDIVLHSPFIHLKKIQDSGFTKDNSSDLDNLNFLRGIANGESILSSKIDEFIEISEERKQVSKAATEVINREAIKIHKALKGKKRKKRDDRIADVRQLISWYVSVQSADEGLSENFPWADIELFENVLLDFFISMEKGSNTMVNNDWFDMFILAYVKPGQKFWTKENKKWPQIINNANMRHYMYDK